MSNTHTTPDAAPDWVSMCAYCRTQTGPFVMFKHSTVCTDCYADGNDPATLIAAREGDQR